MGTFIHHAVVVTGGRWSTVKESPIDRAHEFAVQLGLRATEVIVGINAVATFCVVPCGSKAGWRDAQDEEKARDTFVTWLETQGLDWFEIVYGETPPRIVRKSHGSYEDDE